MSSRPLSEGGNIKVRTTMMLSFLYGCETWSVALGEERILTMFQDKALWSLFGLKVTAEMCVMRSFVVCTRFQILLGDQIKDIRWAEHVARM